MRLDPARAREHTGLMSGPDNPALQLAKHGNGSLRQAIAVGFRQGFAAGRTVGGPCSGSYVYHPIGAVLRSFARAFNFSGTAGRAELLYPLLFTLMAGAFLYQPMQDDLGRYFFVPLWALAFPLLALHMRRLRDMGWPRLLVGVLPIYFPAYLALLAISLVKGSSPRA